MNQTEDKIITQQDIIDYVHNLEMKKASFGGFDKVDVYIRVQELITLYGKHLKQELNKQQQTFEDKSKEIEVLKFREGALREELNVQKEIVHDQTNEIESQKKQIQELMKYKESNIGLQHKIELQTQKIVELKQQYVDQHKEIEMQTQKIIELKQQYVDQNNEMELLKIEISDVKKSKLTAEKQEHEIDKLNKSLDLFFRISSGATHKKI